MRRHFVRSAGLRSVGYDERSNMLEVEFINGHVYRYFAVPKANFDALLSSDSAGRYFNANIRERFPTQPVK